MQLFKFAFLKGDFQKKIRLSSGYQWLCHLYTTKTSRLFKISNTSRIVTTSLSSFFFSLKKDLATDRAVGLVNNKYLFN